MPMTSTTIRNTSGTTITIFNNNVAYQASYYDTKFKLIKSVKFDTNGSIKSYETYQYMGNKVSETDKYDAYNQLTEVLKYTYNAKNQIDNVKHYDATGHLTNTDFYVNGIIDHSAGLVTNGWSNIDGYGSIDVLKALNSILNTILPDTSNSKIDWSLNAANFNDAWNVGYTGKGVIIADIDTGIDLNNKDLTQHLNQYSYNFINNSTNVQDDNGHGSFTAGEMIAANNADSITGGAYDAEIMVLKALNQNGSGTAENVSKAIYYAVDHGADIINMSLNSLVAQPLLKSAFEYAKQHDVLVSVSSGNNLSNTPNYPAIYATTNADVCAVGASFNMNGKEVFNAVSSKAGSNTAYNYVDAGGSNVSGYDQFGKMVTMSGTSMASPLVASEMAILKSALESMGKYANNVIDDMVMNALTHNTHDIQIIGVQPITAVDMLMA